MIDQEVAIELTDGLAVDVDSNASPPRVISYTPADRAGSVSYGNGVFNIGTLKHSDYKQNHSVTLPIRVSNNAVVKEQCLAATITGNPPPGTGPRDDDISDNVAKVCLGLSSQSKVYESGPVNPWTIHACMSDVATNACDTVAEVAVQLVASTDNSGKVDLSPAVIHVKDVPGRVLDFHAQSVTGGNTVSWQTASLESTDFAGTRNGVTVGFDRRPINDYINNWTNYSLTFVASDLNGSDPPGKLALRSRTGGGRLWTSTTSNPLTFTRANPFGLSHQTTGVTAFMIEFEKLGTYVLDTTVDLTHASLQDDESNARVFSKTNRTYFHVGPIAELGVRDGATSSEAASNQVAFTVAVINNQSEDAERGKVVVELPSGTTGLTTIPAGFGTFDGNANPPTWSWNINALENEGRRQSKGLPESQTVSLIMDGVSAGETATAKIAFDPYLVCIGSDGSTLDHANHSDCKDDAATTNDWHAAVCVNTADDEVDATYTTQPTCDAETDREWTENVCAASDDSVLAGLTEPECDGWFQGTVYDYNDANNTATLTAVSGTSGGGEGAPTLQTPSVYTPAVGITWSRIEFLHGIPVKDYQVQWSANGVSGWTQLETNLPFNKLFDITVQSGQTRYYRVRAANEAGVTGPWSAPIRARTEALGFPGISVSETELTVAEGESGEYTVVLKARPISNVTVRVNGSDDVSPSPSQLTFTPSNWLTPQTVTLTAGQDNDAADDTADVTHSISSSDAAYASLTVDPVAVTIIDDDSGVSITADHESVNEGEDINLTLARTGNINNAITVTVNVTQSGDYLASGQSGNRTVEMGANTTSATTTVATDNDSAVESPGTVIANVVGGTSYFASAPSSATVRVSDDDGPPGQPGNLTAVEGDERVELSWNPAPTGDAPVEEYSYRVRRSDSSTWDPDWTVICSASTRFAESCCLTEECYRKLSTLDRPPPAPFPAFPLVRAA